MTESTKTAAKPAEILAAANDEFAYASTVAQAGFPGRLPQAAIEAARKYVNSSRLSAAAASDELAKAAASAAGATGLASHTRNRVAVQFEASKDVVKAAVAAAGPAANTARTLVWFLVAINAAEAEVAAPAPKATRSAKASS